MRYQIYSTKSHRIIEEVECVNGEDRVYRRFTGLYDKNNTPVYEGDILELQKTLGEKKNGSRRKVVEWIEKKNKIGFSISKADNMRIIGNIYHHPNVRGF